MNREIVTVLANVRSIHNVGSIFRTADGVGITKIYLCGITPTPFDRLGKLLPQFAKVALGAERYVKWEKRHETWRVIQELKKDGYKIYALEQDKRSILYSRLSFQKLPRKIALVVGSETDGIPKSVLAIADRILEIPMRGKMMRDAEHPRRLGRGKESLNVSVAFGIVAYSFAAMSKR